MALLALWKMHYITLIFLTENAIIAGHWFPGTTGEVETSWSGESERWVQIPTLLLHVELYLAFWLSVYCHVTNYRKLVAKNSNNFITLMYPVGQEFGLDAVG